MENIAINLTKNSIYQKCSCFICGTTHDRCPKGTYTCLINGETHETKIICSICLLYGYKQLNFEW